MAAQINANQKITASTGQAKEDAESNAHVVKKLDESSKLDAIIALKLQLEEFNQETTIRKSVQKEEVEKTTGGGDCALHAALGKLNVNSFVHCDEVNQKRKELSEAVLKCTEDSPMLPAIIEAIQAILMGEQQGFLILRQEYNAHLTQRENLVAQAWKDFQAEFVKRPELCNYIDTKIKQYKAPQEWQAMTPRQKFLYCLDLEGGLLRCLIISNDVLKPLFEIYNKSTHEGFDLRARILQNHKILEEYAAYIARPGQWLLPVELSIIAHVFHITIHFYTYNPYKRTTVGPEIFNPNQNKSVAIRFDGFGHFERMHKQIVPASTLNTSKTEDKTAEKNLTINMNELTVEQQLELKKILETQEAEKRNKAVAATSTGVKTIKDNEAIAMASVPSTSVTSNNHVVTVVHASATNIGNTAGGNITSKVAVYASHAAHLTVHAADVVHVHTRPREYPLLEKLKAKQMIEWEIPPLSNQFIGRETLIKKLDEILEQDLKQSQETNTFVVNALKGLGGIGKSALALHYIRTTKQLYTLKAWFLAENIMSLKQKYFELAKELGFTGDKETEGIAYLKRWFKECSNWLLVFDNVNSAEEIKDLLPEGKGCIMLTSRFDRWPNTYKNIVVPVMEEKEAIDLVLSLIEESKKANCAKEAQELSTLVNTLQTLPLALVQAGAYINANDISVREYLDLYQKKENEAKLLQIPAFGITERTVAVTWNISLQAIAKTKDMALGIDLLCACAYLSPDNIPKELLFTWMKDTHKLDKIAFNQYVEGLKRYSMIQSDAASLSIHRVVQTVTRHQQSGIIPTEGIPFPNLTSLWYDSLLQAANQEFNRKTQVLEDKTREQQFFIHLQSLVEHYEVLKFKENAAFSYVLSDIGYMIFFRKGNPQLAKLYYERALKIKETHYGKEHVEMANTLMELGNCYGGLGNAKQKKELLERVLKIQEAHYGTEHVVVAITLCNLSSACKDLGDFKRQKELLERALEIQEAYYGKEHVEVATTLASLSNVYGTLGNVKQQKALLEWALKIQEAHYGKDHVQITITLTNLGSTYMVLGEVKQAKELLERALKIKEAHYGKEHVKITITLMNLGNAYCLLRDVKQAKELLEQALKIQETHYGKEHIEVASTLSSLGTTCGKLGEVKQAKELLERALKIQETHYGKEHIEMANTLSSLGIIYGTSGNEKQAKELLERALKIKETHYGKEHAQIAVTLFNLAVAYRSLGNLQEALNLAQRCHAIFLREYSEEHSNTKIAKDLVQECQKALPEHSRKPLIFSAADNKKLEIVSNNTQVAKPKSEEDKCVIL